MLKQKKILMKKNANINKYKDKIKTQYQNESNGLKSKFKMIWTFQVKQVTGLVPGSIGTNWYSVKGYRYESLQGVNEVIW